MKNNLVILMATYNGQKYLRQQLDSIIEQTYTDWHLIIRDDNSSDNTVNIINEYIFRFPGKISLIKNPSRIHGSKNNFLSLAKIAIKENYNYIMFSDQDDVWDKDKVKMTMSKMKEMEISRNIPVLIHTDLKVVDEKLKEISSSFALYSKLYPINDNLAHLLIQNTVTGCTVLVNRALLKKSQDVKMTDDIIMHDWLYALIASIYGKIGYLTQTTISYRQHGNNVVGAKKMNVDLIVSKLLNFKNSKKSLDDTIKQAKTLLKYFDDLPKEAQSIIMQYSNIKCLNKYKRIRFLVNNRILKTTLIRKIGEFILI